MHDIAQQEVEQREQIDRITAGRIANGRDTEVERKTAQANLATSRATLASFDGSIVTTRYQLAALLGAGPDRGLSIARPTLGIGDEVRLPDNLPADLVSRRPDLVASFLPTGDEMNQSTNPAALAPLSGGKLVLATLAVALAHFHVPRAVLRTFAERPSMRSG